MTSPATSHNLYSISSRFVVNLRLLSRLFHLMYEVMNSSLKPENLWTMDSFKLEEYLKGVKVPDSVIKVLKDSDINGSTFLKLTRSDLMDLYPGADNFLTRKTLWDILEDQRQGFSSSMENNTNDITDTEVIPPSPPSGTRSIVSTTSANSSVDHQHSQNLPALLKRSARFMVEKKQNNDHVYTFPISREMRKCEDEKTFPTGSVRSAFIRDCYTCLLATVGCAPSDNELREAAKQICQRLTILKDPKPPAWPEGKEFNEWDSVYYSLKKRGYNKKRKTGTSSTCSSTLDVTESEVEKIKENIIKELKKKNPSNDAIKEMLSITFDLRAERIKCNNLSSKEVIPTLLKEFPYLKNELVLLFELELHVGNNQPFQDFIQNWDDISRKLYKDKDVDEDDVSAMAVESLHNYFDCPPIIAFCQASESEDINNLLKKELRTTSPTLVVYEVGEEDNQAFICIDKEVFLECIDEVSFSKCLILLLATYFTFNLEYESKQRNMFKFLEEFVLKIQPKKRTNAYKRMVSKLINQL